MSETKKTSPKKTVKKEETKKTVKKVKETAVEKTEKVSVKKASSAKYIRSIGRRKTSVAQVRLYFPGKGEITINDKKASDFVSEDNLNTILQPLKVCSKLNDFDFTIIVRGGGSFGQIEAIRHGVARALLKYDPEFKSILKTNGYLTRDPRQKERKKPGLKKARKAPQWSKR